VAELVGDAGDEWRLRPDDHEVCLEGPCQGEEALAVLRSHGMAAAERGDARVPGGGVELFEIRRLPELPRERVLAPTGADQEYLHTRTLARGVDEFPDRRTRRALTAYDPPP
jgi:hypothetical protein